MLGIALIVFRESLEAALFVGIIAAATQGLAGRWRWLGGGVFAGVLGSLVLALMAEWIAALADGVGQDLVNAAILASALAMLVWHSVWGQPHAREAARQARRVSSEVQQGARAPVALALACALAVLREGAEAVLFVIGMSGADSHAQSSPLLGLALGLAGGTAVGGLIYLGLSRIPAKRVFAVTNALILLLAASIASQLARALMQAGLVRSWTTPLWDSSGWIAQDSPLGTVLHALAGYDAQPSGLQLLFYGATLLGMVLASRVTGPAMRRTAAA
jgi:high-affinity iron transporter